MPSTEALYVVEFGDLAPGGNSYRNGGVAVLETNRIFGGDSGYYYIGTFSITANTIQADARIVRHNNNIAIPSVWGDNSPSFQVTIQGTISNGIIQGFMERVGIPGIRIPVRLTWKEALP